MRSQLEQKLVPLLPLLLFCWAHLCQLKRIFELLQQPAVVGVAAPLRLGAPYGPEPIATVGVIFHPELKPALVELIEGRVRVLPEQPELADGPAGSRSYLHALLRLREVMYELDATLRVAHGGAKELGPDERQHHLLPVALLRPRRRRLLLPDEEAGVHAELQRHQHRVRHPLWAGGRASAALRHALRLLKRALHHLPRGASRRHLACAHVEDAQRQLQGPILAHALDSPLDVLPGGRGPEDGPQVEAAGLLIAEAAADQQQLLDRLRQADAEGLEQLVRPLELLRAAVRAVWAQHQHLAALQRRRRAFRPLQVHEQGLRA
mmetsp:Transcript_51663/g.147528  ORF Transcript_51663/g.147528 Transcript_51663/m.147528 type:complete len:321 (+) Transcript_51663:30-992(+)